jgi:hypothetical protein
MKTLFEKMRSNRSKALYVKTAKWLEEAKRTVEADSLRFEEEIQQQEQERAKSLEKIRNMYRI